MWSISCPGYRLAVEVTDGAFVLRRDDVQLEIPLKDVETPPALLRALVCWRPTELQLRLASLATGKEVRKQCDTRMVRPPAELLRWARRRAIAPIAAYGSAGALYEVVAEAFESLQDKVSTTGMYPAFWDVERSSDERRQRPKRETHIHPTVEALLWEVAIAKSLDILREPTIGGGDLDFLISGQVARSGSVPVCVEFKHGHNDRLFHGLEKQLPAYMDAKASAFGIYCVLWFRGPEFERPQSFTKAELLTELKRRAITLGRNIRVQILDLSRPPSPSKL
jgi:hypothetical protein